MHVGFSVLLHPTAASACHVHLPQQHPPYNSDFYFTAIIKQLPSTSAVASCMPVGSQTPTGAGKTTEGRREAGRVLNRAGVGGME